MRPSDTFHVYATHMALAGYGENARTFPVLRHWTSGGVEFVALHVPGRGCPWTVRVGTGGRFV